MKSLLWPIAAAAVALAFATSAAAAGQMTFKLASSGGTCPDCRWIAAEGEIVDKSPDNLAKFLKGKDFAQGLVVRFNSGGGDLAASMELGRLIRERGLRTAVSKTEFLPKNPKDRLTARWKKGVCASACTYAFLGGVERSIEENSRLGVHQFYSEAPRGRGSFAVAQSAINDLGVYMSDMGVSGNLILAAAATAPVNMHWLSREELESYRAVTDVRSPKEADWAFAQAQGGLSLVSHQIQKDGSITDYRVSCSAAGPASRQGAPHIHLTASSELKSIPADKLANVGKSLHGAKLHPNGAAGAISLAGIEVKRDTLQITGDLDRTAFERMIGDSKAELYVDLDVAADYANYVGGASHRFPVKNLGEAMPLLLRNCA